MTRTSRASNYLSITDWRALSATGAAHLTNQSRPNSYALHIPAIEALLAKHLQDLVVEDLHELHSEGVETSFLVHDVLGLPNIPREAPMDAKGQLVDPLWLNPAEGLRRIVKNRLKPMPGVGPVQKLLQSRNLVLITSRTTRDDINEKTGLRESRPIDVYAATRSFELATLLHVEPMLAKRLSEQEKYSEQGLALADALPELAPAVLAQEGAVAEIGGRRNKAVYSKLTLGMSEREIRELDASVVSIQERFVDVNSSAAVQAIENAARQLELGSQE